MTTARPSDDELTEAILALLAARGVGRSIDPSDVARRLLGDAGPWRAELKRIRSLAGRLARDGRIVILRHGKPAGEGPVRGVIRLARGPLFEGAGDGNETTAIQEEETR
ncbi:MAG: DUF3253 domain-containing protein [Hyphomicrobiaceae bacterium]